MTYNVIGGTLNLAQFNSIQCTSQHATTVIIVDILGQQRTTMHLLPHRSVTPSIAYRQTAFSQCPFCLSACPLVTRMYNVVDER